jgi:hypothetical protein
MTAARPAVAMRFVASENNLESWNHEPAHTNDDRLIGYWLAQFMVWMFSSDLFRLPFTPERATFAYASLVVLTAAVLTALAVVFRILKLDMVRVLKAHD